MFELPSFSAVDHASKVEKFTADEAPYEYTAMF